MGKLFTNTYEVLNFSYGQTVHVVTDEELPYESIESWFD